MRGAKKLSAAFAAVLLAGLAASASLAQQAHPITGEHGGTIAHPIRTLPPLPSPTTLTTAAPQANSEFPVMRRQSNGRVPLFALPPLPMRTALNTAMFGAQGGRHTMAANGADINYSADTTGNATCSSASGTIIPVGCDVIWQSRNLPGGQTWQDYFVDIGTSTATAVGSQYGGGGGPKEQTANLSPAGTYVLATFDVTTNSWEAVVYVTVGTTNYFGTYADSGATTPQQSFVAANGTNVYVNATGLVQGQNYVVYAEWTSGGLVSGNLSCVYIAPPGTPNANGFCDPTTSPGITAVMGAQSSAAITATWPLSATTPPGTYAVVLYNLTTHQRLAQRQVSIVKAGTSGSIPMVPVSGNPNLPAGFPTAVPQPYANTTSFAFDNQNEMSDKGLTIQATGLPINTNYRVTISDPIGSVVASNNQGTGGAGGFNYNFNFNNAESPSNYIGSTYTVTLQNPSTGSIDYSQAFRILGYNVATQYTNPAGTAIALPSGQSVTTGVQFTNDGASIFGTGNADTISGIVLDTGSQGITITMTDPSVTSCGAGCQQEIVADTSGQNWTVQSVCSGGVGNAGCTMTAYPATNGQVLAINGSITVPSLQFNNSVGGHCANGCSATISVLPTHGVSWSQTNQSFATNPIYFTNGKFGVPTGTASVTHYGYVDSSSVLHPGFGTQGYAANNAQMTYTSSSPFTSPVGYADEYEIAASNTSPVGTNPIQQIEILLPSAYSPTPNAAVDNANSPGWKVVNCPGGYPPTAICLQNANGNNGIATGTSQNIFLQLSPPPATAFSYTDWTIQAIHPDVFPLTAAGTFTAFVPSTGAYDSTATAAYSLNGNLITPGFSPTTAGQNTNNSITINVTNAATSQDPFPDYLDMIAIDIPNQIANQAALTNAAGMPAGWSLLGTSTPSAGVTRYWFGLCSAQFVQADGPVANPPPVNPTVPSCGAAIEASSIAPGQTFAVTGNLQTVTANITATMYSHGANGAGWSTGHTFTLNVTAVSASAGFSAAGGYPTAGTVTSPNTPQIGSDADKTFGNAYTYVIKNTSGAGQNITSATITIPGKDTSFVLPADGTAWTLTGTPTISGTTYGCSITSSSSATTGGANGAINIGGGSCKITPGSTLTVTFTAKAPYTVNDTYQFPTQINGAVNASEQWTTDTIVQIVLSANLIISVNPSSDAVTGSTPSVNCPSCSFNVATNTVDFGSVANLQTVSGTDVVRVSVYTNAGSTVGWKLYASTNVNPANTAGPTNELLTAVDNGANRSMPQGGVNFDQTAYAVVPTSNPGVILLDTGTGRPATRNPFDMLMNYQISINGGALTPTTSVVTYTFISN